MSDNSGSNYLSRFRSLLICAANNIPRNSTRSVVVVTCLVAVLSPLVTAIAINEGVKKQYLDILRKGPDIYVAGDNYGSNAPIDLTAIDRIKSIQGVTKVVPRIIGRTYVQEKFMAVLGIESHHIPGSLQITEGKTPSGKGEVALGRTAADYLNVRVGTRFSIRRNPEQVFEIVGLFQSKHNILNADLLLMSFGDAAELFGIGRKATDLMVYTRPGYEKIVDVIVKASEQGETGGLSPLRVQTRGIVERYSQRGFNAKAGVFVGFYCLALALAIPAVGVISGFGMSERRRSIGVMKALGWQTGEVLQMVALENLLLGIIGASFAILVSIGWIYPFNGAGVARFFIANQGILIPFQVPAEIMPIPVVLAVILAIILTLVGSIHSTWKTAVVPPFQAMRG